MFRINSEQLVTVFGVLEMEEELSALNNLLNLPARQNITQLAEIAPHASVILNNYFKRLKNVPTENQLAYYHHFNSTIIFATKIGLLLNPGLSSLIDNPRSHNQFLEHLRAIKSSAPEIFSFNNLDAQLFIISKLSSLKSAAWLQTDYQANQILSETIEALIERCNQMLAQQSAISMQSLQAYIHFLKNTANSPHYRDWVSSIVIGSQLCYSQQPDYKARNMVMQAILDAYELIKDDLSKENIEWVLECTSNIQQEFRNRSTSSQYASEDLQRFCRFLISPVSLSVSMLVAVIGYSQYALINSFQHNRIASIDSLIEYKQNRLNPTIYSPQLRQRADHVMSIIEKVNGLHGRNLQEAKDEAEFIQSLIPMISLIFCAAAVVANYSVYRCSGFFQSQHSQFPKPVALPGWYHERLEAYRERRLGI